MPDSNLVENFRTAMSKRGITIKDAARMCGIHADTLERLLAGRTRKIDAQMIEKIAACAALRRNDWYDRHRFIAEVYELPLASETDQRLDGQIRTLMARLSQLEGSAARKRADEPQTAVEAAAVETE
jgi:transcriptional regulator with XRE-family HTH domain